MTWIWAARSPTNRSHTLVYTCTKTSIKLTLKPPHLLIEAMIINNQCSVEVCWCVEFMTAMRRDNTTCPKHIQLFLITDVCDAWKQDCHRLVNVEAVVNACRNLTEH